MRNYLTILFAVAVWIASIVAMIAGILLLWGVDVDWSWVASFRALWYCVAATMVIHSLLFLAVEEPLCRLAQNVSIELKPKYAVAFGFFYLVICAIFFLPFAVPKMGAIIPLIVTAMAVSAGLIAGWARGLLVEENDRRKFRRWRNPDEIQQIRSQIAN